MAAGSAALCSTLLFVGLFVFVSADQKNITAMSGQNVTLRCRAPNTNITAVRWSRADLKPEYVLLYRNGHFDSENQHPSFKDRVDLQDRQMKDGDVSVILKDVTINDAGTYECRVFMRETNSDLIIYLSVAPPGPGGGGTTEDGGKKEGGSVGVIVGLSVAAVLLVAAAVGFLIYRKCQQVKKSQTVV